MDAPVHLYDKLAELNELWSPRIVARLNDYHLKIARVEGDFVWHRHEDTDEAFLVLEGELVIELRSGDVDLGPGDLYVVPRGVEHRPRATHVCSILLIEPVGTVNTGDGPSGALTAAELWA